MNRFYRALLRLYPAWFRAEYGDEMAAIHAERQARRGSPGHLAVAAEVIPNALALHGSALRQDLRYTLRSLRHSRGFALAAVLVTALGIGANTAAFSVANFVLLKPLNFPEPDRLVRLCEGPRTGGGWGCNNQMSGRNYREFVARSVSFQSMGAYRSGPMNLVGVGDPVRLIAHGVTPSVFPILGAAPYLGRVFDSARGGEADRQAVVLSYPLWQTQFGADRGILGRAVQLDGSSYEVIGVMPPGFEFPREARIWTALVLRGDNECCLEGIGRLRPGVSIDQAKADLTRVTEQLSAERPIEEETGHSTFLLRDEFAPRYRQLLLALCGAGLCILLLSCANLANLLLSRAVAREREFALRTALGAGRERLVRQMLTESVVLTLAGGAAGFLLAALSLPLLSLLVPTTLAVSGGPALDLRVLGLATLLIGVTGLGFGLLPALRSAGAAWSGALREGARTGGGSRHRLRDVLVTVQVALSVVLLISSGLLIRAVWRVQAVDPGFAADSVMTFRTALPRPKYDSTHVRGEFYRRVLTEVRALPGVTSAGYTSFIPMVMTGGIGGITIPGMDLGARPPTASFRFVSPGYFETLRIPLRMGRNVEDADVPARPWVAVVSESFVRRFWPNQYPLGKQFRLRQDLRTVVGVVGDVKVRGLERVSEPQVYLPAVQVAEATLSNYDPKDLVVRYSGSAAGLYPEVRRIVRAADPEQPISDVQPMGRILEAQTATRVAQVRVLAALAAVALLLAGVGIHGLLAYTVAQRSQEIAIRLALGGAPRRIARMVLSQGLRLALLGIIPGVLGAYAMARAMRALLFGLEPADPETIGAAVGLVLLIACAGSVVSARRAIRVSPMAAMRAE
jgi:predicted permease